MKLPIHYPSATFKQRAAARYQYIEEQGNKCYFCKEDIHIPPNNGCELIFNIESQDYV